ncbi:MAG: adenylate/guanylate cyclase domain-containing protein, partial [Litorivicinus sp.]
NNQWFLALGAELIRVASGISTSATKVDELGLHTLKLGPYEIQSDPQGQARLAYSALDGVQRIGLVQALAEDGPDLSGALVVLGPSALGLKDFHDTPVGLSTPGPMFHTALMQQILTDTYVTRPYWSRLAEWPAAALLGLVVLYIALRRSLRDSLLGYVVASGLVLAAGIIAYRTNLWVLDSSFGLIYISLCFALGALSKLLIEESAKRQIRQAFATYLAPSVVDQIADNPKELQLGGETRDLTIMFADLRGFTTLSESYKRDPQALTALVNRVMTPMSDAVINNGGTIDKYLGDCLMAFWNAPVAVEKHPDKAAQAALAIQASLQWLNTRLREDNPDMTPLRVAIGINHGLTVVGNFGSDRRFDYTCLGDPVNLASR